MTDLYCAEVSNWSLAAMVYDCCFPSKLPLAWLTLACVTAVRTCSVLRPIDDKAVGLTRMRTAGFWPPEMVTSPTFGSCEILGARRVSARSSTEDSGIDLEVSPSVRMGASAGLVLAYTGGLGRSRGRKDPAALIDACTSCSATSMFSARSNCRVMTEHPSELVEVICVRPGSWPNCRSSGAVTLEAITSGLAPG